MIPTGHWTIQTALQNAIQTYQANAATLTPEIFADAPTAIQQEIQATLGNPATVIPVHLGYATTTPPKLPGIWIYGQPGQERLGDDVLGNHLSRTVGSGSATTQYGVAFQWTWAIFVASTNANQSLALDALVLWGLLSQRAWIAQQLGAVQVVVGWGAWSPMPNSAQDTIFPFSRTFTLSAEAYATWTTTDSPLITGYTPSQLT